MPILGLVDTEQVMLETFRLANFRRRVFYTFPNGAAPLIGLLSMMKEEETNQPEFEWWEKRLKEQRTATAAADPVFQTGAGGALLDPAVFVAGTLYRVVVLDTTLFRPGHVIRIVADSGANKVELRFRVTVIVSATVMTMVAIVAGSVENGAGDNVNKEVQVVGAAFPHGVVDLSSEVYYFPVNLRNHTQIFRTPFSFTGNALVSPVKFDDTGIYKDKAKQHSIDHMIEMELAVLFGHKYRQVNTSTGASGGSGTPDPTTGAGLPQYFTGGIMYWLQQWEATVANLYEASGATVDSDDNKRIIANAAGTLSEGLYDTYLERIFRTTSNVSNEKLVLCGSGFLKVVNQMYRSLSVLQFMPPSGDTYGLEIVAHKTAFGTVYYKSHPLFSRNAALRNSALFVDIHNMRYRNMSKRDTQLLKNRQPNDADYRKDEWFTEAGFEVRQPESFMFLQNVNSYVP
jgi:hypothetical protein